MSLTTLLNYKDDIRALGYDGAPDTVLEPAIDEARRTIVDAHRWSWLEVVGNTELALAYDTPSEPLNGLADLQRVDAVRLEFGTDYIDLTPLPVQELRALEHTDRTPARPSYWTEAAGQLRVYPSPDKAYTLSVDYIRSITTLTDDADVDDFVPVQLRYLVKWKAAAIIAFRQRDAWAAPTAENNYLAGLRLAVAQDNMRQRQQSDQVRTGYWGPPSWL